jgi:hypothetical protein
MYQVILAFRGKRLSMGGGIILTQLINHICIRLQLIVFKIIIPLSACQNIFVVDDDDFVPSYCSDWVAFCIFVVETNLRSNTLGAIKNEHGMM